MACVADWSLVNKDIMVIENVNDEWIILMKGIILYTLVAKGNG